MNGRFSLLLLGVTLVLAFCCSAQQLVGPSDSSPSISTISVTGLASSCINPELISINLKIKTESKDPLLAVQENSRIAAKVQESFMTIKLSQENLSTSGYSISAAYETVYEHNQYNSRMKGYEVVNFVNVKTSDLSLGGKILDLAVKAGVTEITGVSFELKPETKIKAEDELLQSAVENARYKATLAIKALGLKISGVHSMNLNHVSYQPPIYFDRTFSSPESTGAGTSLFQSAKEISTSVNVVFLTEKL